MKIDSALLAFAPCGMQHLDDILALQERAFADLPDASWLRRNSREAFALCLQPPHTALGAFYEGRLIAFAILFLGGDGKENLGLDMTMPPEDLSRVANYKIVIADPAYRGNRLQIRLGQQLEQIATELGIHTLCATCAPDNSYSLRNLLQLGYSIDKTLFKYGGQARYLLCKAIATQPETQLAKAAK